jgi:hypothetical protein
VDLVHLLEVVLQVIHPGKLDTALLALVVQEYLH